MRVCDATMPDAPSAVGCTGVAYSLGYSARCPSMALRSFSSASDSGIVRIQVMGLLVQSRLELTSSTDNSGHKLWLGIEAGKYLLSLPLHWVRAHTALMYDPHAKLRDQVLKRVLDGPGESDPTIRAAAADNRGLPPDLAPLVDKIHNHAYKVTDGDLARLQAAYGDDRLFEIIVSAALGASRKRLFAGLEALEGRREGKTP